MYQPTTGAKCHCRPGIERDNCPTCEGTGWKIDFRLIRQITRKHIEERQAESTSRINIVHE